MNRLFKTLSFILVTGVASMLIGCSGTIGSIGSLLVTIPGAGNASNGLYVDDTMTQGYVILFEGKTLLSYTKYTDTIDLKGGKAYIAGIPEGEYLLAVVLTDEDDSAQGFAIKEISVQPGYNEFEVTIGPGIRNLAITNLKIENNPLLDGDGYSVSFSEDTFIIDYDRPVGNIDITYTPAFGNNEIADCKIYALDANMERTGDPLTNNSRMTDVYKVTINDSHSGVLYIIQDSNRESYSIRIILK